MKSALLLTAQHALSDRWCHLESSSESSKRLYERYGFRVVRQWNALPHAAPFWSMERPPKADNAKCVTDDLALRSKHDAVTVLRAAHIDRSAGI